MEYIISFMETYGYTAMFIAMVLENANVPIPSEIVLGFAGYLIAQGIFDMHTTMVVGILAGIVGSIVSYWICLLYTSYSQSSATFTISTLNNGKRVVE